MKGASDAAIAEYQKARALNDDPVGARAARPRLCRLGQQDGGEKILDQLKALSKARLCLSLQLCPCLSRTGRQRAGAPLA